MIAHRYQERSPCRIDRISTTSPRGLSEKSASHSHRFSSCDAHAEGRKRILFFTHSPLTMRPLPPLRNDARDQSSPDPPRYDQGRVCNRIRRPGSGGSRLNGVLSVSQQRSVMGYLRPVICAMVVLMAMRQTTDGQTLTRRAARHVQLAKTSTVLQPPLPAGTFTVGIGGDFASLDSAFRQLSNGGILGPVTFLLTDTLYLAPDADGGAFLLVGPIAGAGASSRITIRPADNVVATIRGHGEGTLRFLNTSYVTLDGVSLHGATGLNVHALYDDAGSPWNDPVECIGNCDFMNIQNLSASTEDIGRGAGIDMFGDALGAPDSCIVSGCPSRRVPSASISRRAWIQVRGPVHTEIISATITLARPRTASARGEYKMKELTGRSLKTTTSRISAWRSGEISEIINSGLTPISVLALSSAIISCIIFASHGRQSMKKWLRA